jgi:Helix-turn-helix domain/Protein of unknown function (DUF2690)
MKLTCRDRSVDVCSRAGSGRYRYDNYWPDPTVRHRSACVSIQDVNTSQDLAVRTATAIEAFARALRDLRAQAGAPSFRRLAAITHYAPSTLAEATRGIRLPTEQVTRAFARACGADEELWAAHWRGVALQARAEATTEPAEAVPEPAQATAAARGRGASRPHSLRMILAAATAGIVIGAGSGAAAIRLWPAHPTPAPAATASVPASQPSSAVLDGADPLALGCSADSRVLAASPLAGDVNTPGILELRYSQKCRAVWAELSSQHSSWPAHTTAQVTVTVSDGRSSSFTYPLLPVTTQALRLGQFCATAQAIAHDTDLRRTAVAKTSCANA